MPYFVGIDIGSAGIKAAAVDEAGNLAGFAVCPTGGSFAKNAQKAFEELLQQLCMRREDIARVVSTGYGRKLFKPADEFVSEITANARGAFRIDAGVRTVINVGGQDVKVIRLNEAGNVVNFAMNDKCAAGTGRFLEMAARILEFNVDQLGELHAEFQGVPPTLASTCAVFAETEIISLLAAGHPKPQVIAGVHYSIARRMAGLARTVGVADVIFFDGGPAENCGLVEALRNTLIRKIVVPHLPQITTAYGAALTARAFEASPAAAVRR